MGLFDHQKQAATSDARLQRRGTVAERSYDLASEDPSPFSDLNIRIRIDKANHGPSGRFHNMHGSEMIASVRYMGPLGARHPEALITQPELSSLQS